MHGAHIVAVEVVPPHLNAVAQALAGAHSEFICRSRDRRVLLIAMALKFGELVVRPCRIFAARQFWDVNSRITVDPFQVDVAQAAISRLERGEALKLATVGQSGPHLSKQVSNPSPRMAGVWE